MKAIQNDDLVLFETVLSFVTNWCQLWFEHYPSEPVHCLQTSVDVIVRKECPKLHEHLYTHGFTVSQYAWPLLSNLFTEALSKQ